MHLYTAAVYTNQFMKSQTGSHDKLSDSEKTHFESIPNILESWHYVGKQRFVDDMRKDGAQVFLDSGAFSAHTLGVKLSVWEYCEYIKRNMDILRREDNVLMASVLDGIGDPHQTYRNQLEMEARGVTPLPCFHYGEDERYLEHYVREYPYITIGGMVTKGSQNPLEMSKDLEIWLDRIFDKFICDKSGRPRVKVHGFGLTSIKMMEMYPWFSCDSSSWIQYAVYGHIFHPKHGVITVSGKSPRKHDANMHISTLVDIHKDYVHAMLNSLGFNLERLQDVYESRAAFNMWSFKEINHIINKQREYSFQALRQELF
jgi:hypothetical protein